MDQNSFGPLDQNPLLPRRPRETPPGPRSSVPMAQGHCLRPWDLGHARPVGTVQAGRTVPSHPPPLGLARSKPISGRIMSGRRAPNERPSTAQSLGPALSGTGAIVPVPCCSPAGGHAGPGGQRATRPVLHPNSVLDLMTSLLLQLCKYSDQQQITNFLKG